MKINQVVGMFKVKKKIHNIYLVPGLRSGHMKEMCLCDQLPLRTLDPKLKLAVLDKGMSHIPLQFIARKKDMSVNLCPAKR